MSKMSDAFLVASLPFLLSNTGTLPAESSDERSAQPKQCDSIYILSWPNQHKCIFIRFIFFVALWILGSPGRLLQSALADLATRIIIKLSCMFYPRAAYRPFKQHKVEGFLTVPPDPLTMWVGVLSYSLKRSSAFLRAARDVWYRSLWQIKPCGRSESLTAQMTHWFSQRSDWEKTDTRLSAVSH